MEYLQVALASGAKFVTGLIVNSLNAHVRFNKKTILSGIVKALIRKASKAESEFFPVNSPY